MFRAMNTLIFPQNIFNRFDQKVFVNVKRKRLIPKSVIKQKKKKMRFKADVPRALRLKKTPSSRTACAVSAGFASKDNIISAPKRGSQLRMFILPRVIR